MKVKIQHPEPQPGDLVGPRYWRSLDEYVERPEFKEWVHREFPQGASDIEGVNRRHFMKIMAASFAVAGVGLTGCRRPESYILPYAKQPEGTIPGNPVYFSTSLPDGYDSQPLVVETHQHRPTHIEGNPLYQPYGSALSAQASASVLDLYDPDRMTSSYRGTRRITAAEVRDLLNGVGQKHLSTGGQGLAILAEPSSSPTRARLVREWKQRFPRALWAEYTPMPKESAARAASTVFGTAVRPILNLAKAKRILSLDSDFLHQEAGSIGNNKGFAKSRRVENQEAAKQMSRLYAVEAPYSLTGAMADHRLRLPTSQMAAFTALVTAALLERKGVERPFAQALRDRAANLQVDPKWVEECVTDLVEAGPSALVVAGYHLPQSVHGLVLLMNELLGAVGETLTYVADGNDRHATIHELADRIRTGSVETLVVIGGNPVYDAPADLNWKSLQKSVGEVVRYGYHFDETAIESTLQIAATHYLESWSDGRTWNGTLVPVQPMILPLFDAISELEFLAVLTGQTETDAYAHVRATFAQYTDGSDRSFQRFLADGLLPDTAFGIANDGFSMARLKGMLDLNSITVPLVTEQSLEVRLTPDYCLQDGRYNNNGWLQELPDPMNKLTWDNAIQVSPRMAEALGFDTKSGEFLIGGVARKASNFKRGRDVAPIGELTLNGLTIRGPVHIQPGLPDWSILISLGYGRQRTGRVGKGTGFDAYPLMNGLTGFARNGASLKLTNELVNLANTQEHWSMEGRAIVRETNASYYTKNQNWVNEMGIEAHSPPIYGSAQNMPLAEKSLTNPRGGSAYETPDFGAPPPNYTAWQSPEAKERFIPPQQWGMTIDLNTCTGCNSCMVACQSENNIPIVGKDQVLRGREMYWIRLDRYYSSGDSTANQTSLPADPQTSLMPLGCLHCEMAPCEQVCPVNATVHDNQGLNVMAYNRCVGTRYCANNCPYKVRRFNFFDFNKRARDEFYLGPLGVDQFKTEGGILASMQRNPDVTVRMRGVMEKCTYCVQRIEHAKIAQKVKARDSNDIHIPDGVLKTACQAACPAEAIVFGDISDPTSAVSNSKSNDRNYSLLGYLNTRPRTTYLARLRNPNERMPDYRPDALSRIEYKSKQPSSH